MKHFSVVNIILSHFSTNDIADSSATLNFLAGKNQETLKKISISVATLKSQ